MLRTRPFSDPIDQPALRKQKLENNSIEYLPRELIIRCIFQALKEENQAVKRDQLGHLWDIKELVDASRVASFINYRLVSQAWNSYAKTAAIDFANLGGWGTFDFLRTIFSYKKPITDEIDYHYSLFKKLIEDQGPKIQGCLIEEMFEDDKKTLELVKLMPNLKSIGFYEIDEALVKEVIKACPLVEELAIEMFGESSAEYGPEVFEAIDNLKLIKKLDYSRLLAKDLVLVKDKFTKPQNLKLFIDPRMDPDVEGDEENVMPFELEGKRSELKFLDLAFYASPKMISIGTCENLEKLVLFSVDLNDIDWMAISFPQLKKLRLSNCPVNKALLSSKACFKELTQLVFVPTFYENDNSHPKFLISEAAVQKITEANFPKLKKLTLRGCHLNDYILLRCNACFQRLSQLDISINPISNIGITAITCAQPTDKPIEIRIKQTYAHSDWLNELHNSYPHVSFKED